MWGRRFSTLALIFMHFIVAFIVVVVVVAAFFFIILVSVFVSIALLSFKRFLIAALVETHVVPSRRIVRTRTVGRATSPSFRRASSFRIWFAKGGPVLRSVDGLDSGALGEVTSYSAGTCAAKGGGILTFRGRAGGGNVLAGRRLPTLRRDGRLDCCLIPACASFCIEELEAAQWPYPFFERDVSPFTGTSCVIGYRVAVWSGKVESLGAARRG